MSGSTVRQRPRVRHMSTNSSLSSVDLAEPKVRLCPWRAKWCTWTYLAIKSVQIALGIVILALLFIWRSQGLNIVNLIATGLLNGFNYRNEVYCFISVSILSIIYALVMAGIGFVGINLSAMVLTLMPTFGLILWLFSAPFMSATIDRLKNNLWARQNDLDILYLEVATGMSFLLLALFVFDTFLGFVNLRTSMEANRLLLDNMTPPPVVQVAKVPEVMLPSSLMQTPIANQNIKGSMHEMGAVMMKSTASKASMHEMGHVAHKYSENHLPTLLEAGESKSSDVGGQRTSAGGQGGGTRLSFQVASSPPSRGHDEIDAEVITMNVKPPLKGILKPHAETSV